VNVEKRPPGWWLSQAAGPLAAWLGGAPRFLKCNWSGGWLVGTGGSDPNLQWLTIHAGGKAGRTALAAGLAELDLRGIPACVAFAEAVFGEYTRESASLFAHHERVLRHEWMDLDRLPNLEEPRSEIRVVADAQDFAAAFAVLDAAFGFGRAFVEQTFSLRMLERPGISIRLALTSGEPASAIATWRREELVYVLQMGTHPSQQGRGIGREILIRSLADERAAGGRYVQLVSSEIGVKLYRKAGFTRIGDHPLFIYRPGDR
jgi:ribosomal protein S18 acetylase RimI-like enzyme